MPFRHRLRERLATVSDPSGVLPGHPRTKHPGPDPTRCEGPDPSSQSKVNHIA